MNLEKNTKEIKNNKEGIISYIHETSYEDNTFWISYEIGEKIGFEIINGDNISEYKVGDKILVKDKPNISICSEILQELINSCVESENEMWYIDYDEMEEEDVLKIQEEIIQLDKKYKNINLMEYFSFYKYGFAITVYGGVGTIFSF